jgi:hypothetical protein
MCWHSYLPVESSRMEGHTFGPGPGSWVSVMILVLGEAKEGGGVSSYFACNLLIQTTNLASETFNRKQDRESQQRAEWIWYLTGRRGAVQRTRRRREARRKKRRAGRWQLTAGSLSSDCCNRLQKSMELDHRQPIERLDLGEKRV